MLRSELPDHVRPPPRAAPGLPETLFTLAISALRACPLSAQLGLQLRAPGRRSDPSSGADRRRAGWRQPADAALSHLITRMPTAARCAAMAVSRSAIQFSYPHARRSLDVSASVACSAWICGLALSRHDADPAGCARRAPAPHRPLLPASAHAAEPGPDAPARVTATPGEAVSQHVGEVVNDPDIAQ